MTIREEIKRSEDRYVHELCEWLKIPSISADSAHKNDVRKAAEFIRKKLIDAGCDTSELVETAEHPIVYAEKIFNPVIPTVLVYGHYDVQPPDPLKQWISPPFEPTIRGNKIYARGACDDKGQTYMHVKALELLMQQPEPICNVKYMIEGEEEIGSSHLGDFVRAHKQRLSADTIIISDTSMISLDTPSITVGLRGLSYVEVEVTGPKRDLHSGVYGGAVANSINILTRLIASLHDDDGRVTIPGFYDKVAELSATEREDLNKAPFDLAAYKKDLEIDEVYGEKGYNTLERTRIRPALDVNGIWGGYTGSGAKTVLPAKAYAKISMRLVPNQSSSEITEMFGRHFKAIAPPYVRVRVTNLHGGEAVVVSTQSPGYRAASAALVEVFGKEPIPTRDGGSIPIVALFKKELGLESILMGFGLDSDAIHSPNESFGIDNFLLGIETILAFFKHFGQCQR